MAVDKTLCLNERYQDCSKFTITDTSEWLDASPDRRDDAARFLLAAKMDEEQCLTFLDVANSDPFNQLSWTIDSSGIGAYRFFYIDIPEWTTDEYTQNSIVLHNSVYYKAIAASEDVEPGVDEDWEESWAEFNIANLKNEIENTQLSIYIHDDIITCEFEECILEHLDRVTDKELCGGCCDTDQFLKLMKMQFMLDAAQSNNWQQKAVRSEVILKEANKKFCC